VRGFQRASPVDVTVSESKKRLKRGAGLSKSKVLAFSIWAKAAIEKHVKKAVRRIFSMKKLRFKRRK
jgi:hypothetical protein